MHVDFALRIFTPLLSVLLAHQVELSFPQAPLIPTEHIDYIFLRLSHLLDQTPREISKLRALLNEELERSPAYKEAWTEGTEIFKSRKSQLVNRRDLFRVPDEYHIALITYTIHDTPKDWPFYSVFNSATRKLATGTDVENFKFKSFFQLLHLAVETLGKKKKFAPKYDKLFRGVTIRYDWLSGQDVAFQQFTSLSENRTVSEIYSGGVTLLVFKNMENIGISMEYHSKFPGESEILVSPFQVFEVTKVVPGDGESFDMFEMEPTNAKTGFRYFCDKKPQDDYL